MAMRTLNIALDFSYHVSRDTAHAQCKFSQ